MIDEKVEIAIEVGNNMEWFLKLFNVVYDVSKKATIELLYRYNKMKIQSILLNELIIHSQNSQDYFTDKDKYIFFVENKYFDYLCRYCVNENPKILETIHDEMSENINSEQYNRQKFDEYISSSIDILKKQKNKASHSIDQLWCETINRFFSYNGSTSIYDDNIINDILLPSIKTENKNMVLNFNEFYREISSIDKNKKEGRKIEILGPSGSGKSTLALRLWKLFLFEDNSLIFFYNGRFFENFNNIDYDTILNSSDKSEQIIVLLDGYNELNTEGMEFFKNFNEKTLKNNITYIYTSTYSNNVGFEKMEVCLLDEEVVKEYLQQYNKEYDNSILEILRYPLLLTLFVKIKKIKCARIFDSIDNEANLLWNYIVEQAYKEESNIKKSLILYVIPNLAYEIEKAKKIRFGISEMNRAVECIMGVDKKTNIPNLMMEIIQELNNLDKHDIVNLMKQLGFFKIQSEGNYMFFHEKIQSFFVAVNLVNDDQLYVMNGEHLLIKERYLDNTLLSNKYYNDLYKDNLICGKKSMIMENLLSIYEESSSDSARNCVGNIIGDIECGIIYDTNTTYDYFLEHCESLEESVKKYSSDDYGLWSKAFFYECISKKFYDNKIKTNKIFSFSEKIELFSLLNKTLVIIAEFFYNKFRYNLSCDIEQISVDDIQSLIELSESKITQINEIRIFHVLGHLFNCKRYKRFYDTLQYKEKYAELSYSCYNFVKEKDPSNRFAYIGCVQYYEFIIEESYKKIYELYGKAFKNGNLWARRKMAEMLKNKQILEKDKLILKDMYEDLCVYKISCRIDNQQFSNFIDGLISFIEEEIKKYDN